MAITTEEHRQAFIDCIESAILNRNSKLVRSLIVECEIYSENVGVELLTLDEIVVYYSYLQTLN